MFIVNCTTLRILRTCVLFVFYCCREIPKRITSSLEVKMSQKWGGGRGGEVRTRLRFKTLDFLGSTRLFVNYNLDLNPNC